MDKGNHEESAEEKNQAEDTVEKPGTQVVATQTGEGSRELRTEDDTLGIISVVSGSLGLLSVCCCNLLGIVFSLAAVVCGFMAQSRGRGLGTTGLILGFVALGINFLFMIFSIAVPLLGMLMEMINY